MNGSSGSVTGWFGSTRSAACRVGVSAAIVLLVGAVGISAFGATGAAAPHDGTTEAFLVELEPDGDATVTLRLTYDLGDARDEQTFEQLEADATNRSEQFRDDLARIATRTERETGREMDVTEPGADVRVENGIGIVELRVRWTGLAAIDGDTLTVSEPFASQYQPDRQFVVEAPEGYTVERTAVSPTASDGGNVTWAPGSDLTGVTVTAAPSDTDDPVPTALPVFVGLLALWALVHRLLNTPCRRRLLSER